MTAVKVSLMWRKQETIKLTKLAAQTQCKQTCYAIHLLVTFTF